MSRTIEGTSLLSEIVIQISDMDTPSPRLKALILDRIGQDVTGDGFPLLGRALKRVRSRVAYPAFIDFALVPLLG